MVQDTQPDIPAAQFAIEAMRDVASALGTCPKGLRAVDYVDLIIDLHPNIDAVVTAPDRVFYRLTDFTANNLAIMCQTHETGYAIAHKICTHNTLSGEPIPEPLRPFAYALLDGRKRGFRTSGKKAGVNFGIKLAAICVIKELREIYGLPTAHGAGSNKTSAVQLVKDAMDELGVYYSFETIRDWTRSDKSADLLARVDGIIAFFNEEYLTQLGVVNRPKRWLQTPRTFDINIWGQFSLMHLLQCKLILEIPVRARNSQRISHEISQSFAATRKTRQP